MYPKHTRNQRQKQSLVSIFFLNLYKTIWLDKLLYIIFSSLQEGELKKFFATARKQKQRKEEQPRVPRSLFDKPKEVVMKQRRDAKMQRLRQNLQVRLI